MLELETVKRLLPKSHRTLITQEFLDKVSASIEDKDIADQFKDNFISYLNVLSTGRYKMEDYVSAVKYVSFKLLGYSNIKAYAATFPERYDRLVRENQGQIDAFVSMYNKNKLVTSIYEQTIVPTWVLNAPLHQEALNTLAEMLNNERASPMVKVKACETILQYTKQPEIVKGELTIGIEQSDTINELREVTENLASAYKDLLVSKSTTLKDLTERNIIDVTPVEEEDE